MTTEPTTTTDNLREVVAFLTQGSPPRYPFSNARLTKMVYLADWKAALTYGRQITQIRWVFNHYGPWVPDVVDSIRHDPAFRIEKKRNGLGGPKEEIRQIRDVPITTLLQKQEIALTHVVDETIGLDWTTFIRLVYSTFPVVNQPRFATLDLPMLASEYKRQTLETK